MKKYMYSIHPEIVSAEFKLDLYPEQNKVRLRGDYIVKNIDNQRIDTLFLTIPLRESAKIKVKEIALHQASKVLIADTSCHFFAFLLGKPLLPGDSLTLSYELEMQQIDLPWPRCMYIDDKWSLIESRYFVLTTGYGLYRESNGGGDFFPLSEQEIEYANSRQRLSGNRLRPPFRYTVSYPSNQRLIGDGNLESEYKENSRTRTTYSSFHYMDLSHFPIILSPLYDKITDTIEGIQLSVFYSPIHSKGAQGLLQSAKKLLQNFSEKFGALPIHTIQIVEAPNYRGSGATAYSNTVLLNEGFFTYDFRDTTHYNKSIFTLAHELAHFWWGGLLKTNYLPGSKALIEGLAEFSALQQLDKFHRKEIVEPYVDFFVKRVHNSTSIPISHILNIEEDPWSVYYYTPFLFRMLSLNIGEGRFNELLRSYLSKNKDKYTSLFDFSTYIQGSIQTSDSFYVNNVLTKTIKYENRIRNASIKKKNGLYEVSLDLEFSKFEVDSNENITKMEFSDIEKIDISFFKNDSLMLQKDIQPKNAEKEIKYLMKDKPDKLLLDYKRRYIDEWEGNVFYLR